MLQTPVVDLLVKHVLSGFVSCKLLNDCFHLQQLDNRAGYELLSKLIYVAFMKDVYVCGINFNNEG